MRTFRVHVDGKTVLQGRDWLPDSAGTTRAVVQLVHGLGEHGLRYAELAARLNRAGFAVVSHDNRGHGLTAGRDDIGMLPPGGGWQDWIGDILRVAERIPEHWPGVPHLLLGHSLGSLMVQHVAASHGERFDGFILSATDNRPGPATLVNRLLLAGMRPLLRAETRSRLLYLLGVGHLRASVPDRRTDADWLSRDPERIDAYLADPLCNFLPSTAMWGAIADGMKQISGRWRGRLAADRPVLLLVGGADPLSAGGRRVRRLARAYRRLGASHVTLLEYPGARHELFNEINREQVASDLVGWLQRLPSIRFPSAGAHRKLDPDARPVTAGAPDTR